ncbi:MAG: hypothetical protein Q9170_004837 [Blastenia crenularia]
MSDHDWVEYQLLSDVQRGAESQSPVPEGPADNEAPGENSQTPEGVPTTTTPAEDISTFINKVSIPTGQQPAKRKAASMADGGTRPIQTSKRQKASDNDRNKSVRYLTSASQLQEGKLKRIPAKLNDRVRSARAISGDPFEVPIDSTDDDGPSQAQTAQTAQTTRSLKPPKTAPAISIPIKGEFREPNVPASEETKKPKKPPGRPKGSKALPKVAKEGSGRTTRSQKANGVTSPSAQLPKLESPSRKSKAKSAVVSTSAESSKDEESGPSPKGRGVTAGEAFSPKSPDHSLPQESASAQRVEVGKVVSSEDRLDPHHSENIEVVNNADIEQDSLRSDDFENESNSSRAENPQISPDEPLFGTQRSWQKILKAGREIGVSRIKGQRSRNTPQWQTKEVKPLVEHIRAAIVSYKDIASGNTISDGTMDKHQKALEAVNDKLNDLPAESDLANDKASGFIHDIYARAIPHTVILLKWALKTRGTQLSDEKDIITLRELIGIESALFALCDKARKWKAKPQANNSIIQPTVTIKPLIESMRTAFMNELRKREHSIQEEQSQPQRLREIEEKKRAQQEEAETRKRERKVREDREWREIMQHPGYSKTPSQTRNQRSKSNYDRPRLYTMEEMAPKQNQTQREEDRKLLVALWAADEDGEMSAEERYLQVLNEPEFKNRLPSYIKERALLYKEAMIQTRSEEDAQMDRFIKGEPAKPEAAPVKKVSMKKDAKAPGGVYKASPKDGITPKHTTTAVESNTTVMTPSAARPTASSASRNTPKGNLAKPSIPPVVKADVQYPQNVVRGKSAAVVGHRVKNSVSSSDGPASRRVDTLSGEDNDIGGKAPCPPERAASKSPIKSIRGSLSKRSSLSLASPTTTNKMPYSTIGPSLKATSVRGMDDPRMRSAHTSANGGRIGSTPTQAKVRSNASISKGSTIPSASPHVKVMGPDAANAALNRQLTSPKKIRPGLVTRKSTMSVTIEQRLREMSLVHEMLRAAMAEEGDENDEAKEEYGKQMDDTLAALKARLEEAKSNEGLLDLETESEVKNMVNGGPVKPMNSEKKAEMPVSQETVEDASVHGDRVDEDTSRLREREKILLEQLEGIDVSAIEDIPNLELKVTSLDLLKARSDYESLEVAKHQETGSLQETIDSLTGQLHSIQASHQSTEREVVRLGRLNDELQKKIGEHETNNEREITHHNSIIQELRRSQTELIMIKDNEIAASHEAVHELEDRLQGLEESEQRKTEEICQINESLQNQMNEKQQSSKRDLSLLRQVTKDLQDRVKQYEDERAKSLEVHSQEVAAIQQELCKLQSHTDREKQHQQEAIESLQGRICQMNETKERELEDVKQSLAKEHGDAVAGLQLELDNALARTEKDDRQQEKVGETGESRVEATQKTYRSKLDQLRATLASVHASATELRHEIDDNKRRYEEDMSGVQAKLEHSEVENTELRAEIESARQQIGELGKERNAAQLTLQSNEEGLKLMSEGITSLQEQLTIMHDKESALLEKNTRAEKELAATNHLLGIAREQERQGLAEFELERERWRSLRGQLEWRASEVLEIMSEGDEATAAERVETLRADVETAKKARDELATKLQESKEAHKAQVRELQSALKVTTAELVELKTERPEGRSSGRIPIPSLGLRSSRWAKTDSSSESSEGDVALVGEGLSSHIQGQV